MIERAQSDVVFRNEIVFFKANPTTTVKHPPSRRKEPQRRNRSVPRSSDKVTQDLLRLITEPVKNPVNQDSSDDDQKRDNPVGVLALVKN